MAILALTDLDLYVALHALAIALADAGAEVFLFAGKEPADFRRRENSLHFVPIERATGIAAKVPWFRSGYPKLLRNLSEIGPDVVVAHHQYTLLGLNYKYLLDRKVRIAAYYSDHWPHQTYNKVLKHLAFLVDAYVDVCDVRLGWRREEWPRLGGEHFIIRNAPTRQADARIEPHSGPTRVVFASSSYVLSLNRDRLSRFMARLFDHGISLDWYLPGPEEIRSTARTLSRHPLYTVHPPVNKSQLMATFARYDAGLHWAPMAEKDRDPTYFMTAASNKIGEYVAAGLIVTYAGNPGLAYLPEAVSCVFDPTDPEAGADQVAAALKERATVESKRQAALQYHKDDLNCDTQAMHFIEYVMQQDSRVLS